VVRSQPGAEKRRNHHHKKKCTENPCYKGISDDFSFTWVRGEIWRWTLKPGTGHLFFLYLEKHEKFQFPQMPI
jgi:hypothetical protein